VKENDGVLFDLKLVSAVVVVVVVVVATIFSISKNDRVFTNLRYYTVVSAASLERCTFCRKWGSRCQCSPWGPR